VRVDLLVAPHAGSNLLLGPKPRRGKVGLYIAHSFARSSWTTRAAAARRIETSSATPVLVQAAVSQLQGRCGGRGTGEAAHVERGAGEPSRDLRVVTARYSRVVPTVTGNVRGSDHAPRCIRRCHSGFLRHAESSAQEYGLDVRGILIEVGRRGLVGGQEDMIGDVALDLLAARNPKNLPFGGRAADPFGATVGAALKTVP
jgi:hypothetical protein